MSSFSISLFSLWHSLFCSSFFPRGLKIKPIWVGILAFQQFDLPSKQARLLSGLAFTVLSACSTLGLTFLGLLLTCHSITLAVLSKIAHCPLTHCLCHLLLVIPSFLILSPTKNINPTRARFLLFQSILYLQCLV